MDESWPDPPVPDELPLELPPPDPEDVEEDPPPSSGAATEPEPPSVCVMPLATSPGEGTDTGSRGSVGGVGSDGDWTEGAGTEGAETDGAGLEEDPLPGTLSARLSRGGTASKASSDSATTALARAGRHIRRRRPAAPGPCRVTRTLLAIQGVATRCRNGQIARTAGK